MTPKSISIKGQGCKSGRWVAKAVEPASGGLGLEPGVQEVWRHWLGGVACRLGIWGHALLREGGLPGLGRVKAKRKGSTPIYFLVGA